MPTREQIQFARENPLIAQERVEKNQCPWCEKSKRGIGFCDLCKGPWEYLVGYQRFQFNYPIVRHCPLCAKNLNESLYSIIRGQREVFCDWCREDWSESKVQSLANEFPFLNTRDVKKKLLVLIMRGIRQVLHGLRR